METRLHRHLGLPALTFYGVGIIVGAGVYSVIGAAAAEAGPALWWSFALAAVPALVTGLSYAELATALPEAGAEFTYLGRAFPRAAWLRFGVGVVLLMASSATATTVAFAFADYLGLFVELPRTLVAAGLLGLCAALTVAGLGLSSWVNIAFTCIEVAGLVAVVVVGVGSDTFTDALGAKPHPGVFGGAALIFFMYLGFEDLANLAEEARAPERTLPRAILASLALTTLLYVAVALAVTGLARPADFATADAPLVAAVEPHAPRIAVALGGVALFATANTALITLLATSRLVFAMARAGHLPGVLAGTGRHENPFRAGLAALVVALLFLPLQDVSAVAGVSSLASLMAFASVNLAVIALRRREPGLERPFRVPGSVAGVPVLPVLGMLAALGLSFRFPLVVALVTAGTFAAAMLLWIATRRIRGGSPA